MTSELEKLCRQKGITATATYGVAVPYTKQSEWQHDANPWTVKIRWRGRTSRLTVPFWTGSAITSEPTAADVLNCLISDARAGEDSFEEFCAELGYNEDSRAALATWKQCQTYGRKVRQFLGDDFDAFADAEH